MPENVRENVIIVGAGHAGVNAAETLRREGFAGRIVLVSAERHLPYQRPPLSKKLLGGELTPERIALKPEAFYKQAAVELLAGTLIEGIDRAAQTLSCRAAGATGSTRLSYDRLLLCLGSEPRRLDIPGARLSGVHYLRTLDDVAAIRSRARPGAKLVVVGGGYIGLEAAATCRKLGLDVTVLEMAERVMNRVVAPQVSAFYAAEHERQGVRIVCNTAVSELVGDDAVREVVAGDGRRFAADLVVVGTGVAPATALARAAGIACDNGIAVDEHCRTSAANVFAAGDCTCHPSPRYGRRVRLESVDNAFEQGRTAALNLAGKQSVHDKIPWFWSDQYDLKLLIAGLSTGYDEVVVRGAPASRAFSVCYLRAGELIAVDAINSPKDYMAARKLIAQRARPDPARLADSGVALADCLAN